MRRIQTTGGRAIFGFSLLISWGATLASKPSSPPDSAIVHSSIFLLIATVLFIIAAAAFTLRRQQTFSGVICFSLLALMSFADARQPGGAKHGQYLVGAALAAYLVVYIMSRAERQDNRESSAQHAACGVVGAAYTLAGLSKICNSGFSWAGGSFVSLLIAGSAYAGSELLKPLRLAIAQMPLVCGGLSTATLIIECSGVLFLFPRFRRPYALAAVAMHLGVRLLMGLGPVSWLFLIPGLAFFSMSGDGEQC